MYQRARRRIPGGTQLLSKRPEMFAPDVWPPYYSEARGAEVVDLDGNRFVDMSYAGIGSCVLGYADPDVDAAVMEAVRRGSMSTLNCPEEVELAELLCEIHPWAEMVRYARTGGEALAIAIRLARAATGKDVVAFCGYHGWSDWYLAANLGADALTGHLLPGLAPDGVPGGLVDTAVPFLYNRLDELDRILAGGAGRIAAIVMEPRRRLDPEPGFLSGVRERASHFRIPLIFDEVTAAWRQTTGGIHLALGVEPDVAVFAKGIGNGYPMAAVIGRSQVMDAAQRTFVSSTFWTERIGPCAALATIRKHRATGAPATLRRAGEQVQSAWRTAGANAGVPISVGGMAPLAFFMIEHPDAQALRTYFTQRMLEHGFLATNAFYAMCAHTGAQLQAYASAVETVFNEIGQAIADGRAASLLAGPQAHTGFARLA